MVWLATTGAAAGCSVTALDFAADCSAGAGADAVVLVETLAFLLVSVLVLVLGLSETLFLVVFGFFGAPSCFIASCSFTP